MNKLTRADKKSSKKNKILKWTLTGILALGGAYFASTTEQVSSHVNNFLISLFKDGAKKDIELRDEKVKISYSNVDENGVSHVTNYDYNDDYKDNKYQYYVNTEIPINLKQGRVKEVIIFYKKDDLKCPISADDCYNSLTEAPSETKKTKR